MPRPRPRLIAVRLTEREYQRWHQLAKLRRRTVSEQLRLLVEEECIIALDDRSAATVNDAAKRYLETMNELVQRRVQAGGVDALPRAEELEFTARLGRLWEVLTESEQAELEQEIAKIAGSEAQPGHPVLVGPDPHGQGGSMTVAMGDSVRIVSTNQVGALIRRRLGSRDDRVVVLVNGEPVETTSTDLVPWNPT